METSEICISEVFGSNVPGVVILIKEFLIPCFFIYLDQYSLNNYNHPKNLLSLRHIEYPFFLEEVKIV